MKDFSKPFLVDNHEAMITPSIGISMSPLNGDNSESLLKAADAAMYLAKVNGGNNFQFYNTALNASMSRKIKIENELRKAVEKNQLMLFYQPIIELQTKQIIGMEALLRWEHPDLGFISPVEFIPIAEDTGQINSKAYFLKLKKTLYPVLVDIRSFYLCETKIAIYEYFYELKKPYIESLLRRN